MPWILQREERGYDGILLVDLICTDIPGYQNFVRMPPACFDLIEEYIHHSAKNSVNNFRMPLLVGLKLAIMLRHLETGEMYTSLQYHSLVYQTTIYKLLPVVFRVSLAKFQQKYLTRHKNPEDWKKSRRGSESVGMSPMHLGTRRESYCHEEAQKIWQ